MKQVTFSLLLIIGLSGCFVFGSSTPDGSFYERSKEAVEASEAKAYIGNLLWPVEGKTRSVSWFGLRGSKFHDGVDIALKRGVPVLAAHDGTVIRRDQQFRGYGKLLVLKGDNIVTMYAHMDEFYPEFGDYVRKGDTVGLLGQTGRATGPHLHFETRILNSQNKYYPVDPMVFFPDKSYVK